MLLLALGLIANAAEGAKAPGGGGLGGLFSDPTTLLMIAGPLLLLWLVVLNPQRRQERERKALLSSLQKNDEVVTMSGIIGTVVSIKEKAGGVAGQEDVVTIRIDDKTRLPVLRSAIMRLSRPDSTNGKEAPKEEAKSA
jgi:preprotein translocase subunit YajC